MSGCNSLIKSPGAGICVVGLVVVMLAGACASFQVMSDPELVTTDVVHRYRYDAARWVYSACVLGLIPLAGPLFSALSAIRKHGFRITFRSPDSMH